MNIVRLMTVASAAGAVSLILAGGAVAESASVNLTGPNSNQSISVDNKTTDSTTNNNSVKSVTTNVQSGASGNSSATNNTTVGGLTSGGVMNQSSANNSVVINNSGSAPTVTGGQGSLVLPSTTTTNPIGPSGGTGSAVAPSGGRGGVLGASTAPAGGMGAAILPVTGPIVPVDVSALRAAWHPSVTPQNATTVRGEQAVSTGMLVVAGILSLIGALLTAMRAQQKQRKSVPRA